MKRLLLTVLTTIATILSAVANAPVLAFSESMITLAPGESKEVHIVLVSLDESMNGFQIQFTMYDANHNRIDGPVKLDSCYSIDHDGTALFHAENISSSEFSPGNMIGNANGLTPEPGIGDYRFAGYGGYDNNFTYWNSSDVTEPENVFAFTIKVDEDWNEEMATFELDLDWTMFVNWSNEYHLSDPLVLTIRNSNFGLPTTEPPVISYSLTDEAVNVTATGAGDVKLYKDGIEVENPCTITRTSVDQTFTFSATAKEEGKLISETTTMVIDIPAKPTERCLTPSISYGVTAVGVATITITNNEEGATVYYWVYRDGDLIKENSFTGDSHRFEVSGIGSYTLQAIAKKEGMLDSYAGGIFFTIFEDPIPVILGDVNGDGWVGITDLNAMLNIIFYDGAFVVAADMNKDLIINVQDVVGLVHYLLNGEIPSISSNGRRTRKVQSASQASLYWQDGVLYLNSDVPVSAINIINEVDGDITWDLDKFGMVVMQSTGTQGEHSVIFSFDRSTIPSGVNAIATTNSQHPSVVGAELSNLDSELIPVNLNDQLTELTSIQSDNEFNCHMDGSSLIIKSNAALHDIDVSVYSIDGRVVANQHLPILDSGRTCIDMNDIIKSNRYMIIVVRNGRQILATKKLTQIR